MIKIIENAVWLVIMLNIITSHTAFPDRSITLKAISSQLLFYYMNIWINIVSLIKCTFYISEP